MSHKTSAVLGEPEEAKLRRKIQNIKETSENLNMQMKLKNFMDTQEVIDRLNDEKQEHDALRAAIHQQEYDRLMRKAEDRSELDRGL